MGCKIATQHRKASPVFYSVSLFAFFVFFSGCNKETNGSTDTSTGTELTAVETDGGAPAADENADEPAATDTPDPEKSDEPEATVSVSGDQKIVRARGKAKRGHDVSLSRDLAANHARKNLSDMLKKSGIMLEDQNVLEGAAIERYWNKGRYIYAEAVLTLPAASGGMNESPGSPSKQPDRGTPEPTTAPNGGGKP
jgi:hypothetical protein